MVGHRSDERYFSRRLLRSVDPRGTVGEIIVECLFGNGPERRLGDILADEAGKGRKVSVGVWLAVDALYDFPFGQIAVVSPQKLADPRGQLPAQILFQQPLPHAVAAPLVAEYVAERAYFGGYLLSVVVA